MEGGPWYATREAVKAASDVKETARLNAAIDRNLERCARDAEQFLLREHFYPLQATLYFDWPSSQQGGPWNLWLGARPLISLSAVSSGGTALTIGTDVFFEPVNVGPPYSRVRINAESQASWSSGPSGWQHALGLTGLWGWHDRIASVATLSAPIATTGALTADVSNSAAVGVGDLVQVDTERMIVTGKQLIDTAVNSSGALASEKNARSLAVPSGAAFAEDEIITIDAESMRIDRIAGNTLIVTRAVDGSTLAAHSTNADIYAPRRLTISRGFGGTTPATHLITAPVLRWIPPLSLTELVLAETQNAIAQEDVAWARVIGVNEAQREAFARGLLDLRKTARRTLGRRARKAVIA